MLRFFVCTIVSLLGIALPQLSLAADSCAINKPPHDAAISGNHGSYFFVYPRHVSPSYSGCQIMWDELGRKVLVFRFREGKLLTYSSIDYSEAPPTTKSCSYRNGSPTPGVTPDCPPYDSIKDGLLNVDPADEPPVPKERDARLR